MFQRLSTVPLPDGDGRVTYVVSQQRLAQSALAVGQLHAARTALRSLRVSDFERPHRAEIHLGVLRDNRSERRDVQEAAAALAHLAPRDPRRRQAAASRKMSAGAMM
jgi:hypothetical protein